MTEKYLGLDLIPGWDAAVWNNDGKMRLGSEFLCVCGAWKKHGHINQCNAAMWDLRLNWVLQARMRTMLAGLVVVKRLTIPDEPVPFVASVPLPADLFAAYAKKTKCNLQGKQSLAKVEELVDTQERRYWTGLVTHAEAVARALVSEKEVAVPDSVTWEPPPNEEAYKRLRVGAGVGWVPLICYAVEAVRRDCAAKGKPFDLFARMIPRTKETKFAGSSATREELEKAGEPVVVEMMATW